ncbi:RNA polymerase sigma factor [Desulfosporosinus meridiei]|uniref:RNA polymerase sigma factor, sigma-70 family n=1 Tax=Desulfosporosinus meridiei (strain ATCC BAA-275 / DSM 13257 / KCTC 12902 / NCIMB 13706 / S10) TaxID=768704 RepID=J7IYN5_DESMD|nr:sigma-70 family RNA polymerase sigma factor [Desulfosporosinus meridiei]AFQ45259.1 RNA polymerase sigma factor, sigma-70 family [Desulfosporosinus meridiei DSM 13257]
MVMMIIAVLADDSDKAFALNLYHDYYGLVRKTIYNITHDLDNLEDLINDTFLKLVDKISLIRTLNSCKTAAYVFYSSRSVAINFIKHRDVETKHLYYGEESDLAKSIPDGEDTIVDKIIQQEEIEKMGNAILKLPENQKELLYFKYILDMDDREIAPILNIAPDSVRQYLTRARKNAKKMIGKEMDNYDK